GGGGAGEQVKVVRRNGDWRVGAAVDDRAGRVDVDGADLGFDHADVRVALHRQRDVAAGRAQARGGGDVEVRRAVEEYIAARQAGEIAGSEDVEEVRALADRASGGLEVDVD